AATTPAVSGSGLTPFLLHVVCDISHCRKRLSPRFCSRHNQARGGVPQLRIHRPKRPRPRAQFRTPTASLRRGPASSLLCHWDVPPGLLREVVWTGQGARTSSVALYTQFCGLRVNSV